MPLKELPTYNPTTYNALPISRPGSGGINLYDLEYEQDTDQSPNMLNMMYRNGSFSKRYGQEYLYDTDFDGDVYNTVYFNGKLVVHAGDTIYIDGEEEYIGVNERKGLFFTIGGNLYYLCDEYYIYDGENWGIVEPYIPDVLINRRPDPANGAGNAIDDYNMVGAAFRNTFHGDGSSTVYTLAEKYLDKRTPKVTVDGEDWTYDDNLSSSKTFKINYETGVVTFSSAPGDGDNNVEIVAYKTDYDRLDAIYNSKYATNYGGNNDSRVFLAGAGKSFLYYSSVYDPTYFPENNYIRIGNTEEDITGMGKQYNILVVFKPREMYSITYYTMTSSDTVAENKIGLGAFKSQPINSYIGCDCPDTIQLVNSQLTWLSSLEGVCTLVSTNVLDERNVRGVSRNINRTNFLGITGLLDWENIRETVSADYDGKYFLANPTTGQCFMWDYIMAPYGNTGYVDNDAKRISWFLFDNIYAEKFQPVDGSLLYIKGQNIVKLNSSFDDFGEAISAVYMTPLFEFNVSSGSATRPAVEYLKTIKNVYVQCRGEHPTQIEMRYITEENRDGEPELEGIVIPAKLWNSFTWESFDYAPVNFMSVFRRKCSIKKVQVMGIKFTNDVANCDMSISHLTLQYTNVKYVK